MHAYVLESHVFNQGADSKARTSILWLAEAAASPTVSSHGARALQVPGNMCASMSSELQAWGAPNAVRLKDLIARAKEPTPALLRFRQGAGGTSKRMSRSLDQRAYLRCDASSGITHTHACKVVHMLHVFFLRALAFALDWRATGRQAGSLHAISA